MQEMTIDELHKVQIGILNCISEYCKEQGLQWWLECGTLLGAVRHHGYIPWDDDIDVAMLRYDYETLRASFNEWSVKNREGRYQLLDPELDKGSDYPFGKVIDTTTELYEGTDEVIKIGVYVDVFVYDNAPANKKEYLRMLKCRDVLGKLRKAKLAGKGKLSLRRVRVLFVKYLLFFAPVRYITKVMARKAKKYQYKETGKVADLLWPYEDMKFYFDKSFFEEQIALEFEGRMYPAPRNYDEWLRYLYDDYMKLPSEDQRARHNIKAFFKHDS